VEVGVGAVATQSFANVNFGPQGLALLREGLPAGRALAALIAGDDLPGRRQVALIDDTGTAAVHTGKDCIPYAGHVVGEGFSAQANMMTSEGVPEAMASAFGASTGHLAERIMAALEAAQAAGGDIRGSQSAAILVREPGPRASTWDLRIDNSRAPLEDLRTLLNIRLAGRLLGRSRQGEAPSLEAVEAAYAEAAQLYPSDEQAFWFALDGLAAMGELDRAVALLEPLFARAPQWKELLRRLDLPNAVAIKGRFGF
jgi:uncharacterized Ntn-hydrolase superfamily protein